MRTRVFVYSLKSGSDSRFFLSVETLRNAVMYRARIAAVLDLSLFVRYLIVQLDTLPVLSLIFTSKVRM